MKMYNIITIVLIIYLAIMAYIGKDMILVDGNYLEYFLLIALTLVFILLLRLSLKNRIFKKDEQYDDDEL